MVIKVGLEHSEGVQITFGRNIFLLMHRCHGAYICIRCIFAKQNYFPLLKLLVYQSKVYILNVNLLFLIKVGVKQWDMLEE